MIVVDPLATWRCWVHWSADEACLFWMIQVHTDGSAADAAATVGVESKRAERDREREAQEKDRAQIEMGKEKERERELEREQVETEQRRELESQRELEKEKERSELSKAGARSGKSTKAENGRVQKGERAGLAIGRMECIWVIMGCFETGVWDPGSKRVFMLIQV